MGRSRSRAAARTESSNRAPRSTRRATGRPAASRGARRRRRARTRGVRRRRRRRGTRRACGRRRRRRRRHLRLQRRRRHRRRRRRRRRRRDNVALLVVVLCEVALEALRAMPQRTDDALLDHHRQGGARALGEDDAREDLVEPTVVAAGVPGGGRAEHQHPRHVRQQRRHAKDPRQAQQPEADADDKVADADGRARGLDGLRGEGRLGARVGRAEDVDHAVDAPQDHAKVEDRVRLQLLALARRGALRERQVGPPQRHRNDKEGHEDAAELLLVGVEHPVRKRQHADRDRQVTHDDEALVRKRHLLVEHLEHVR